VGAPAPTDAEVETLSFQKALVMPGLITVIPIRHRRCCGLRPRAPLDLFVLDAMARRARTVAAVQWGVCCRRRDAQARVTGPWTILACGLPTVEAVSLRLAYEEAGLRAAVCADV